MAMMSPHMRMQKMPATCERLNMMVGNEHDHDHEQDHDHEHEHEQDHGNDESADEYIEDAGHMGKAQCNDEKCEE